MVGWHHRLNGHGFGWTPWVGDGQGGLVCCDLWCRKESDTTEWLNWIKLKAFDYMDDNKLWKTLNEIGVPDHLTCLLRNLHVGQETTVRTLCFGKTDWFRIEKGVQQGCLLSLCLFNLYADHMWNVRLDKLQAGIKIVREI